MTQELNWYTTYNLPLTIGNQSRINDYVNKLSNKSSDKTVETKITQIEKEYQNKLKEIEDLCLNKDMLIAYSKAKESSN